MTSIRTKLFLAFMSFAVVFVLASVLLNSLLLERYYVYRNEEVLARTGEAIARTYARDPAVLPEYLRAIDRVDGISSTIVDRDLFVKYTSFPHPVDVGREKLASELELLVRQYPDLVQSAHVYAVVESPDYGDREMVLITRVGNGEMVALRKPMKGVSESTAIANQFAITGGLILVAIGGVLTFIFSARITRPVIAMSGVAEGIASLDFSQRANATGRDELASLGRSLNRMAERLSASMSELRADVERRKTLVRNISHELKSPIAVIKGYAEGLQYGVASDPESAQAYCAVISTECDRMDALVRELLDLSALESGVFQLRRVRFDAGALCAEVGARFARALAERPAALEVRCPPGLTVTADRELVGRALGNFVGNAGRHVSPGGTVVVTGARVGAATRFTVANAGAGIAEGDLESIWLPFFKVDRARTRQGGGHGLGLSIVRSIADLHGGRCWAENTDAGVAFYLELPDDPRAGAATDPTAGQ